MPDINVSFARSEALWLLLILPIVVWLGMRVGRKRGMRRASTWLRAAAVAFLCLALAEPLLGVADTASSTIFVVDRSSSIDTTTSSMVNDWVNEALESGGASDRAAIISFGASPELLTASAQVDEIDSEPPREQ